MNTNTANGLLFIIAGLTPFIVYLGLGPDGAAILDQARAEQLFAYLFFSLPIAIMMSRRIEKNYFIDGGLVIIVASMSMAMAADAFRAAPSLADVAKSIKPIAVTRVKRPDNHLGNIVVLKIPMPHIVTPKMVDE